MNVCDACSSPEYRIKDSKIALFSFFERVIRTDFRGSVTSDQQVLAEEPRPNYSVNSL